jgi:hypothetical protein
MEFNTTNVIVEYPAMQRHKNQRMQQQQQQQQQQYHQDQLPPRQHHHHHSHHHQGHQQQQSEMDDETSTGVSSGFYIKIYGLPANFDDQALKNMFNNVKFLKISTAKPTPISTKFVNQDGSTENSTVVKAKKLCQVETQLDLERALTRQDERVGKSKVCLIFF